MGLQQRFQPNVDGCCMIDESNKFGTRGHFLMYCIACCTYIKNCKEKIQKSHYFPYENKTNIPNFFQLDIVNILEVRYVCFDYMWKVMDYSRSLPYNF